MPRFAGMFRVMTGHDDHHHHDHHHDHDDHSELSETELRVRALETILTEKGYVDQAALDAIIQAYETKIGPHNGAQVVAKAWTEPAFRQALLEDATKAVSMLGHVGRVGDHLVAIENTPERHNMVVCTLCSCYPWEMLGLPPVWYKAAPYRSRAVKDPRGVLADFGVSLPKEIEIRVWDSTAETRFLVLPMRPPGTEGWSEAQLTELVTRDSMIGTGFPKTPGAPPRTAGTAWGAWMASARASRSRTNRCFTPNGKRACWPWCGRWARPARSTSIRRAFTGRCCGRTSISAVPITRSGSSGSKTFSSTRALSPPKKSPPDMRSNRRNRSSAARLGSTMSSS